MTAIVLSNTPSIPASNSSGTSTTAARGGRVSRASSSARHSNIRAPTRGHSIPLKPLALLGPVEDDARRSPPGRRCRPGATSSPQRSTSWSRSSGSPSSSCTTASVDSVAAPSRSNAARASDFPAPIPPVRPTNGMLRPADPPPGAQALRPARAPRRGVFFSSAGGALRRAAPLRRAVPLRGCPLCKRRRFLDLLARGEYVLRKPQVGDVAQLLSPPGASSGGGAPSRSGRT